MFIFLLVLSLQISNYVYLVWKDEMVFVAYVKETICGDDIQRDYDILEKEVGENIFRMCTKSLQMHPLSKSCLSISISRLELLPLVMPILEIDVQLLENKIIGYYREDDSVFYVCQQPWSEFIGEGRKFLNVKSTRASSVFQTHAFQRQEFFDVQIEITWVREDNHRVITWCQCHIDQFHLNEIE